MAGKRGGRREAAKRLFQTACCEVGGTWLPLVRPKPRASPGGDTPYLRIGMGGVERGRLKTAQRFFQTLMQVFVNLFGQCFADAFDLGEVFFAGGGYAAQAAEAGEQGLAAFAAHAGDVA